MTAASAEEFVVHQAPVWRERSNFVINAELPGADLPKRFEQLLARQIGDDRFELCHIPFFLRDGALGDVVRTAALGERKYVMAEVVEPSGRYLFRVWFGQLFQPREEIERELTALGSLTEWSSRNLLAVDAWTPSMRRWSRTFSPSARRRAIFSRRRAGPDQPVRARSLVLVT